MDPVAINILGIAIRWYALAYILAFVIGLWLIKKIDKTRPVKYWDDLFSYVILGIILGGRLGYVLFYNLSYFAENPIEIFYVWQGGMSFHGGLAGAAVGALLYAWKMNKARLNALNLDRHPARSMGILRDTWHDGIVESWLQIIDRISVVAPIGLFFGRIANFINMRPWAVSPINHGGLCLMV